jgi:hypothetical protein
MRTPRRAAPGRLRRSIHRGGKRSMAMSRTTCASLSSLAFALLLAAAPVAAQGRLYDVSNPATGERYKVEFSAGLWSPSPNILVSSAGFGIIGDEIDAVNDLGVTKSTFTDLRVVLRPSKKHKFRFSYVPIGYTAESTLHRKIDFNGIRYAVGLPVNSQLDWKTYRFGYELDFLYRDRWFVGLVLDAKYTDVNVVLDSPVNSEYVRARAPIPTIGGIVRFYPVANVAITGELTGFKLPESIDERYRGRYVDFDLNGTVNFNDNFGAQAGYRSLDVFFQIKDDTGSMTLKGLYVAGVARF